jgi:hypothetical protein
MKYALHVSATCGEHQRRDFMFVFFVHFCALYVQYFQAVDLIVIRGNVRGCASLFIGDFDVDLWQRHDLGRVIGAAIIACNCKMKNCVARVCAYIW